MALSTLPKDNQEDEKLNPGQQDYNRRFDDIAKAEEAGTFNDIANNFDKTADSSQEDKNIAKLKEQENNPEGAPAWKTNVVGDKTEQPSRMQKVLGFAKKRGAIVGILGILGIGGGFAGVFLGPSSILMSFMEELTGINDSASVAKQERFFNAFGFSTGDTATDLLCNKSSKNIKCKMGRVSNKALTQLAKKNVTVEFPAGTTNTDKKTGYPSKNPSVYIFDAKDGSTPKRIQAPDLPGFLANNPKQASMILGTGGAISLQVRTWTGKNITQRFYKKFGIERKGGLADGQNRNGKYADVVNKLREKIPGLEKVSSVSKNVEAKVTKHLGSAKKGGAGYTIAVAGCVGVKAPGYIAGGVAAIQLAQIAPIVMDVILSPGSSLKASGVDPASKFNGDDMSQIGSLLTNRTARKSDGKLTSALDSQHLLAAAGINKGKPPVSADFTPGFSILTNPAVIAANQASKDTEPACNAIMSPAAMYSALALDSAATVVASTTVVGGFIKVIAGLVVTEMAVEVAKAVVGSVAENILIDMATNDKIANAEGEELGDVLGISASAFFSAGGMAQNLPVLKTGAQLQEFAVIQQENNNFQRDMDIASLSPFDTSSKYTFLGSIVHNINMATITSGNYSGFLSTVASVARAPLSLLSPTASAASFNSTNCGYAPEFALTTTILDDVPAINMAGLPCTGITAEQAAMSTNTAIDLIQAEGWLDETKQIKDNSSIDDLMKSGYIKPDTALSDYITNCGDASTGDYLFNAASCTINTSPGNAASVNATLNNSLGDCSETGCPADTGEYSDPVVLKNSTAMAAIPVFLLDFQITQMVNGEDEGAVASPTDGEIDLANIFNDSTEVECADGTTDAGLEVGYYNKIPVPIRLCSLPGDVASGNSPRVNSRVSGAVYEMLTAMKNDLGSPAPITDSFRTMAQQECVFAGGCGAIGPAAIPGTSNHQMGIALDFNVGVSSQVSTAPGNPVWEWLNAHAGNYGFRQLSSEAWHWSPVENY